jgi:alanine racemase
VERTFVEISRQKLIANYRVIRRTAGDGVEVVAVVKADAYGHGAVEVARALEGAGAGWFAVTSVAEGIELRRNGIRGRILVLADLARDQKNALAEFDLTLTVHSVDQLQDLEQWARLRQICPRVHLEIDSGMGRLGLEEARATEVADLLARAPHLRLEGLATHFASAEDLVSRQTEDQIRRFQQLAEQLAARGIRPRFVHMANSAALAYWPQTRVSMVRPGLALYGYLMPPRGREPVEPPPCLDPILSWKARILTVKEYGAGAPLGYNASFRTDRPMRVGVVAAGYADGLDRRLSNGGIVLAAGRPARIVGLVSMDVCLVDLSAAPELAPGDCITLLGQDGDAKLDALQMAERCGAIPYEILCGIGKRCSRVYQ